MCEHYLIRATIIPEVTRLIAEHFGIPLDEALARFYHSATAENLADEENGLFGQSARFVFSQFLEEVQLLKNLDEKMKLRLLVSMTCAAALPSLAATNITANVTLDADANYGEMTHYGHYRFAWK